MTAFHQGAHDNKISVTDDVSLNCLVEVLPTGSLSKAELLFFSFHTLFLDGTRPVQITFKTGGWGK